MTAYTIVITEPGGAQTRWQGLYSDCFAAVLAALDQYPLARRIAAFKVVPA